MTEAKLALIGLGKSFGPVAAVSDVSIALRPGEFVSLLGPSGCGKTTTLRMIAGFMKPTAGRIEVKRPGGVVARPGRGAGKARHVDDLPKLCDLAEHDGRAETSPSD